ncbi:60S ribosomal protein L6-B, putative [Entamoeba invadens IP1]|uniref:60S ribosomal protein L6-B, putative n=1 Tax=Entamoeba invadens IP1 TaxID=370355 RepID=A0A0A1U0J4_ENTIV|nr:60S ribosomal protein L6-B, putative [Entamoeba invadens IP1]ELP87399.1 60S ribosomal protein L6-B, putative [Entamoeba invadens IP1]|eukprot:XP_004254170.1 60S ribosomal protein L6-B, putative [Entamoeba invadens IP1]
MSAPKWFVPTKSNGTKMPEYYPTDDMIVEQKRKLRTKKGPKQTPLDKPAANLEHLRKSIVPGVICIIVAGKYAGKKVVYLKQCIKSGSLIVTGPFKLSGVPLLQINQRYVIATSQKVDVSKVNTEGIDFMFFKKNTPKKRDHFRKVLPQEEIKKDFESKKEILLNKQKQVDETLIPEIKKTQYLKEYMKSPFSVRVGQFPHLLKF